MKTKVLGLAVAMLGMLASCSSEIDVPTTTDEGDVCSVSFKLTVPSEMASRSFSDGKKVDEVFYAIYDVNAVNAIDEKELAEGEVREYTPLITGTITNFKIGQGAELTGIDLVNQHSYEAIFWADASNTGTDDAAAESPYTFDTKTMSVSIDYNKLVANNDKNDAFTAYCEFKVDGPTQKQIILKRPFAQINFGTDDLDRAHELGFKVATTSLKFYPYTEMNLKTGAVGEASTEAFTIPTTTVVESSEAFPVDKYTYLSMNYILAPVDKETTTLTLVVDDTYEVKCTSIPIQRNYRTNIYGSLLTKPTDIFINISPEYEKPDNIGYSVWDGAFDWYDDIVIPDDDNVIHVETARQLARIAAKLSEDDEHHYEQYTVKLENNIDMNGYVWTPIAYNDPMDFYFSGEFDGNGKTIKNLKINGSDSPYVGFFGSLEGAKVHDLIFEDVVIFNTNTASPCTGVLAGYNNHSEIENITLRGKIIVEGYNNVGGLIGESRVLNGAPASIKNININATEGSYVKLLKRSGGYVGGLVGYSWETEIENIESNLDVIGYNSSTTPSGAQARSAAHVGGVLGGFSQKGAWSYSNCKVSGNLSLYNEIVSTNNDINVFCITIGGIVGSAYSSLGTATFNQCSFTGNIFVDNQGEDYTNTVTTYNTNYKYLGCFDAGTPKLGNVSVND